MATTVEVSVVIVSTLGDSNVDEGDVLDLDNSLLHVGGRRQLFVGWQVDPKAELF